MPHQNMRKFLGLLSVMLVLATAGVQAAPQIRVTGTVIDSRSKEPLPGVLVEVSGTATSSARNVMSDIDGQFNVSVPAGTYTFKFSYLGYRDLEKIFDISESQTNLGIIGMDLDSEDIEAVVFEVPAMRTSQKGDTVIYNAAAFKVAADADTESLLAKMPGIMISADGTVEAQGEEIKKILVDGKEFFGEDVSTAIKNLPAEMVQSVEIFNKLSDQAEFTGLDDGEGYKAINIVTVNRNNTSVFGKLAGSYGYPKYYSAGGNVNIFNGDTRLSVIGLANNLNQQNFAFEDILGVVNNSGSSSGRGRMQGGGGGGGRGGGGMGMGGFFVRPMDGISSVQSIGLNYSDTWGRHDRVEVSGSYFFNHSRNHNDYYSETWRTPGTEYEDAAGSSLANNYNHRLNARIEYNINDNQSIMIRPWFSFQSYDSELMSQTDISDLAPEGVIPLRSIVSDSNGDRNGYNAGLFALYRLKLGKPGRTITINASGNFSKNEARQLSEDLYYIPKFYQTAQADSVAMQRIFSNSHSYSAGAGATYTEPINTKSQLSLEYRFSYQYSDADRLTYLWDPMLELISPQYSELLSSINNSGYMTQRVGPGYRYANGNTNISASVMYQYSMLDNNVELPVRVTPYLKYTFNNVVYFGMANINIDPQNSLRINLSSRTGNPSISQLQDIPDFTSSTTVRGGNPALVPSYSHYLNTNYVRSDIARGQTFTVSLGLQYTSDYIGDSLVTYSANRPFIIPGSDNLLQPGQRYSRYANIGNSWQIRTGLSYGLPVKFLGSNLNFNVGAIFSQTPNILDGERFMRTEQYYNGGIQLSSNISQNVDFTLRYDGSYNIAGSQLEGTLEKDRFVNQYVSANLKWVFWRGFTFTGSAAWTQNRGITDDYNEHYLLCNLFIGKKVFRNRLGEVSLGVNDLFNQNTSFRRTVASSYIQNITNLAIGRYISLQFIYNLRSFGGGQSSAPADNFQRPQGGMPAGGPPPMMR